VLLPGTGWTTSSDTHALVIKNCIICYWLILWSFAARKVMAGLTDSNGNLPTAIPSRHLQTNWFKIFTRFSRTRKEEEE